MDSHTATADPNATISPVLETLLRVLDPYGWLKILVPRLDTTVEEERAFANHLQDHVRAAGVAGCITFVLGAVLFWPTDWWVFADDPTTFAAFQTMRLGLTIVGVASVASVYLVPALKHVPFLVCLFGGTGMFTTAAYNLARLGGLDSVWFYGVLLIPFVTNVFVLYAWQNILMNSTFVLGWLAAYFLPHPEYLNHPFVSSICIFLAFMVFIVNVVVGHMHFSVSRSNYIQTLRHKRDVEQREQLLGEINTYRAQLEALVAERTEQVRHLATNLQTVQESERRALAREVHDQLGQWLTGLDLELQTVAGNPGKANLDRATEIVGQLKASAREVINLLRPDILDRHGLRAALVAMLDTIEQLKGIRSTLVFDVDDEQLDPNVQTALYRIVQEATTNIVRHSGASTIHITFRPQNEELVLIVADNGQGFDSTRRESRLSGGAGLPGIEERVRLLQGQCTIRSEIGGGTTMEVRIRAVRP